MSAMSSAKSTSSSFDVKFHFIPVLFPAVVFLIIQSTTKKINPDITSSCLTPVLTLNHSDSSPSSNTAHSLSSYVDYLVWNSIALHDFP